MLDSTQIEILNLARDILKATEEDARDASFKVKPEDHVDGHDLGKLGEACDAAQSAIFNVLNIARSYCHVPITDEQMHNHKPEEVEVS